MEKYRMLLNSAPAWLTEISTIVAIVGGLSAAFMGIISFRKATEERRHDLLWKQASAAKEFVKEIHDNEFSAAAISMLDWFVLDREDDIERKVKYEEVLKAIPKIATRTFNSDEHKILDRFDWFFYYIDRTEQHIQDGLFRFDNVKYVFYPYYQKINKDRALYEVFMRERCYLLAPAFWKRFEKEEMFNCIENEPGSSGREGAKSNQTQAARVTQQ